ncbi:hypothetical protein IGI04_034249 [Brassica rapa subsp. trilocularis]|uniref:Anaphase-promoting complex subunit 4 WD40 domain-containing protein n=1 Tax=Brassica rapa subsp. trilocularis TaxID=1813537 RepID=A0ABQ7L864_BRACM|nr:hypothetical protein IGI04_034249 [Brassica rapa subsp. trilocularis]
MATKSMATLDSGTTCSSWNYSGHRLAAGSIDGTLSVYDSHVPSSYSSFTRSSKVRVSESSLVKIVWLPSEYGDAVACICEDGSLSIWEEVSEDTHALEWKLCKSLMSKSTQVLDVQFGVSRKSLKMVKSFGFFIFNYSAVRLVDAATCGCVGVNFFNKLLFVSLTPVLRLRLNAVAAYSDGYLRVFELLNPLELKNCQLQAEFQNVIDSLSALGKPSTLSASVSWNPMRSGEQEPSFVLAFNSDSPHLNSSKIWEFDEAHNRWLAVAELASPEDKGDPVYAVSWAPNIGRPYEVVAVGTHKGIGIWQVGLAPDLDGRLPVKKAASLSGHQGEVWEMEWDMSGMTLATTGSDGMVRLWQSNLNGEWHEQAMLEPVPS